MVLELKLPHGADFAALAAWLPVFLSYILSFVFVGIYWNNHHHLLHTVTHVQGRVLWANLFLLFWLSLIPFGTAWMGENNFAAAPVALYGGILLGAGFAYSILVRVLIAIHGSDSVIAKAIGRDTKGIASVVLHVAGIALVLVNPLLSCFLYLITALIRFIPD